MKENLKFIKFFSIASLITFICCYITALVAFDFTWLNNSFLFSIFSGVFASFIVVLITEIKKYIDNKRMSENSIYANCIGLYTELTVQIKQLDMYINNKTELFPGAILERRMPTLTSYTNALRFIDYTTIKKKSRFSLRFSAFIQQEIPNIDCHIANCGNLQIAVIQTQINYLKQGVSGHNPTAADPLVNTAAQKIKASAEARRTAVSEFLQTMVSSYPNRFNWNKEKEGIDKVHFDIQEMQKNREKFFEN